MFLYNFDIAYYILKAVERVCWWQSIFNFTCLVNMITSGFILGIINLVISAYKIWGSKEANRKSNKTIIKFSILFLFYSLFLSLDSRIFRYVAWWEEMTQVDSLIFEKNPTSKITIDGIIEKGFRTVWVTLNKLAVIFYIINILLLSIWIKYLDDFSLSIKQFSTDGKYS